MTHVSTWRWLPVSPADATLLGGCMTAHDTWLRQTALVFSAWPSTAAAPQPLLPDTEWLRNVF